MLRAALVNRCFSAEGLSQVGSTGRGAAAAAAMHKPPRAGLAGLLHGCSRLCCCHGTGGLLLLHGADSASLGLRCAVLLQHPGWTGAAQPHPTCNVMQTNVLVKCWVACLRAGKRHLATIYCFSAIPTWMPAVWALPRSLQRI